MADNYISTGEHRRRVAKWVSVGIKARKAVSRAIHTTRCRRSHAQQSTRLMHSRGAILKVDFLRRREQKQLVRKLVQFEGGFIGHRRVLQTKKKTQDVSQPHSNLRRHRAGDGRVPEARMERA